jgi:hypothetical protein
MRVTGQLTTKALTIAGKDLITLAFYKFGLGDSEPHRESGGTVVSTAPKMAATATTKKWFSAGRYL